MHCDWREMQGGGGERAGSSAEMFARGPSNSEKEPGVVMQVFLAETHAGDLVVVKRTVAVWGLGGDWHFCVSDAGWVCGVVFCGFGR